MPKPRRGEIWYGHLDPVVGHEQAGRRPVVVVSDDFFNQSAAELAVVVPLTTRRRGLPLHVDVPATEGGLRQDSYIMCEAIRCVSTDRLEDLWGELSADTMYEVEDRLRRLLML